MKLVDYLRALLSQFVSKNDTAFISHQAMPNTSDNSVEIAEDVWVATADGAIRIYVNDKPTDNGNFINIRDSKGFILQQVLYSLNEGGYKTIWQPVTKGMKYKMEHKFTDTTPKYSKTFFKTMGGGNFLHSLGGVLCLLSSSVHYLKRSLAVRKVGLVTSLCHQVKSLNCLLSQIKFKGIRLHAMGGSLYLRKELERVFVTLGHRISVAHLMAVGAQLLSCSEKANSLTTNSNQIRQTLEYSSSSPSALYNLSFGGASC